MSYHRHYYGIFSKDSENKNFENQLKDFFENLNEDDSLEFKKILEKKENKKIFAFNRESRLNFYWSYRFLILNQDKNFDEFLKKEALYYNTYPLIVIKRDKVVDYAMKHFMPINKDIFEFLPINYQKTIQNLDKEVKERMLKEIERYSFDKEFDYKIHSENSLKIFFPKVYEFQIDLTIFYEKLMHYYDVLNNKLLAYIQNNPAKEKFEFLFSLMDLLDNTSINSYLILSEW